MDLVDHFADTAFIAKLEYVASWDSSGSEKTGLYLRFGRWPADERSFSPADGYHEEGVSAYDLDRHGNPSIDHGLDRGHEHSDECDVDEFGTCQYSPDPGEEPDNDPREEMQGRVSRAERNRYSGNDKPGETAHLVRGEMSGVGYDGEPLLTHVRRVGDWIDHRHLFFPEGGQHRLARNEDDEDYEPPEETPHHHAEAAARPGRGEKTCLCCKGNGSHADGSECDPCDESGLLHSNEEQRYCPGQPQPRRRHWRQPKGSLPGDDYGYEHRPLPDAQPFHEGAGLGRSSDLTHYRRGEDSDQDEAMGQLQSAQGNPDHPVRIYRAAPHKSGGMINTGDWVTTAHGYARDMADDRNYHDPDSLLTDPKTPPERFHVYEATVPARHLRGAGTLMEHGYWGDPIQGEHSDRCGQDDDGFEVHAATDAEPSGDYKILDHFEAADSSLYHGVHVPPGGPEDDPEWLAPMHDVRNAMPRAYEAPREYPGWDAESGRQLQAAEGKPDHPVTVYRALPADRREINTGDWVTTSGSYARTHGESNLRHTPWHVVKADVPARHLFNEGYMSEWGYQGPHVGNAAVHYVGDDHDRREDDLGPREAAVDDYRMTHGAPNPAAGHKPLYHYTGEDPDDRVRIYRAAPAGTEAINSGDWVSRNPAYAHRHGYGEGPGGSDWPVYTAEVHQKHVHWDENDEDEHGYNGPEIWHPDVHDEETGELHDWDSYHDAHPHGREAWIGSAVHMPQADHDFVHDPYEDEEDRANRLLGHAHAQGALHAAHWRGDDYDAKDDAVERARQTEAPEGHRVTMFHGHRKDDGRLADLSVKEYSPAEDEPWRGGWRMIDTEETYPNYSHQALDEAGRGHEATAPARWYHATNEELADGAQVLPAAQVGRGTRGGPGDENHAWVSNDPIRAGAYGTNIYEVTPSATPRHTRGPDDEHQVPSATVVRKVPYAEARTLSPSYQAGAAAYERQRALQAEAAATPDVSFRTSKGKRQGIAHTTVNAYVGDSKVGYARMIDQGRTLDDLYVHPDHRGSGVGHALMGEVVRQFGHNPLHLYASPFTRGRKDKGGLDNDQLQSFYSQHGFTPVEGGGRSMVREPEAEPRTAALEPVTAVFEYPLAPGRLGEQGYRIHDESRGYRAPLWHPGGGTSQEMSWGTLHMMHPNGESHGRLEYGQVGGSDAPWRTVNVEDLQVPGAHAGHGIASALMDHLYGQHPEPAEITHSIRTDSGAAWWDRYTARRPHVLEREQRQQDGDSYDEPDFSTAALNPPERQRRVGMVIVAAEDPVRYFHGTNAEHAPGAVLTPTEALTAAPGGAAAAAVTQGRTPHVFFTTDYKHAAMYASVRAQMHGGTPHVYEVHPQGDFEPNPADERTRDGKPPMSFRSTAPLAVSTEVLEPPKKSRKKRAAKTAAVAKPLPPAPRSLGEVLATANDAVGGLWLPETPSDWGELLDGFPGFFGALADGLDLLGGRLDDCPVDEHLPSIARSMASACRTAADDATEINERVRTSFMGGVNG